MLYDTIIHINISNQNKHFFYSSSIAPLAKLYVCLRLPRPCGLTRRCSSTFRRGSFYQTLELCVFMSPWRGRTESWRSLVWSVCRTHQYSSLSFCSHLHSSLSLLLSLLYIPFLSCLVSFSSHLLKHPNTCVPPTHLISSSWVISCGVLIRLIICTTLPWDLLMQKQTQCNLHIFVPVPLKSSNYRTLRMISKGVALRLPSRSENLSCNWIISMFCLDIFILKTNLLISVCEVSE